MSHGHVSEEFKVCVIEQWLKINCPPDMNVEAPGITYTYGTDPPPFRKVL